MEKIMEDIEIKDIDFNNLELVVSYYLEKTTNSIVSMRYIKNEEVPEEVLEHFKKLGYIK